MARTTTAPDARARETSEAILAAALRAFSQRGFDGASTRDIATAAGVHHGLIRHHFGSKLKLWQAAADRAFANMAEGLEALLEDPAIDDDRERIGRIVRAHVHFVAQNPEFVLLMFEEGKRRGPRMRWLVDRHVKPLYESLLPLITRARSRGGLLIDTSPVHVFYVMAGAAGAMFHQAEECRRLTGVDPFDPEVVEEHARVVERLLVGPPDEGGTRRPGKDLR
ncbi:MAG: TetR/AcrR family transcriptional regulator [Myxococcota bacterium]